MSVWEKSYGPASVGWAAAQLNAARTDSTPAPTIVDIADGRLGWPLAKLAHWVGVHVLHLTGPGADWHPTGSGDTAMNYTLLGCVAVLALVGAAIWTTVDDLRATQGTRFGDDFLLIRAAESGQGLALVRDIHAREEIAQGRLALALDDGRPDDL